jgi:hypothetical protein
VAGSLTTVVRCTAGETHAVTLPAGLYAVQEGGKTYKVVVQ